MLETRVCDLEAGSVAGLALSECLQHYVTRRHESFASAYHLSRCNHSGGGERSNIKESQRVN